MNDDDELCLCFHVTRRKVKNYIRIERPKLVSLLSECGGAGTGCGWCRPMLRRLFDEANGGQSIEPWPDVQRYAADRANYRKQSSG